MHELGITEDLIKSILHTAEHHGIAGRINKVFLKLGKDSGVSDDSMKFWFETSKQGTELENTELEISSVEGREITVDTLEAE